MINWTTRLSGHSEPHGSIEPHQHLTEPHGPGITLRNLCKVLQSRVTLTNFIEVDPVQRQHQHRWAPFGSDDHTVENLDETNQDSRFLLDEMDQRGKKASRFDGSSKPRSSILDGWLNREASICERSPRSKCSITYAKNFLKERLMVKSTGLVTKTRNTNNGVPSVRHGGGSIILWVC